MHKTKLDNINSGFTLIETAIAIAIFAVVITSSLYAFNRCMSMLKSAKDMNIATSDIRSVCEQLRREVDLTGTIDTTPYPLMPGNINTTEQVTIAADTTQIPIPVTATITWQEESQRPRSISVDMLLEQR